MPELVRRSLGGAPQTPQVKPDRLLVATVDHVSQRSQHQLRRHRDGGLEEVAGVGAVVFVAQRDVGMDEGRGLELGEVAGEVHQLVVPLEDLAMVGAGRQLVVAQLDLLQGTDPDQAAREELSLGREPGEGRYDPLTANQPQREALSYGAWVMGGLRHIPPIVA